MNLQDDDPGAVFRKAMPEADPPPARFDLDRIVRDGYRARRRHRVALGGAATTGVAAVAAVLALSMYGLPSDTTDAAENPTDGATTAPLEEKVLGDPEMAGYPYVEDWGAAPDDGTNIFQPGEELLEVKTAATEEFGELLEMSGLWDDPVNPPPDEECSWLIEQGATDEEIDECKTRQGGIPVGAHQKPGNYSQTYLRSYGGGEVKEEGNALRTVFGFEVLLPGGWTAEPGPITEQLFPQHLISDGPYFTDEAPAFTTNDLNDGRTLMMADHGCAAELAVVYPNGTALRVTWNNCSGNDYQFDTDSLTGAALSMPEFEFDTSELVPVGELNDVPMGWVYDEDAWAESGEAEANASVTYDMASTALRDLYPGATLSQGGAVSLGQMERGAIMQRSYSANGSLPFSTTVDGNVDDIHLDLRYYLPGGWIPGFSETGHWDGHLTVCKEEFECNSWSDDDGTMWAIEERSVTHEPQAGEGGESFTEHEFYVTRYSPEGWAVGIWVSWQDDAPINTEMLGELLLAMPDPMYDEEAVPTVPAG